MLVGDMKVLWPVKKPVTLTSEDSVLERSGASSYPKFTWPINRGDILYNDYK